MSQKDFEFTLGEWDADVIHYAADGTVAQELKGSWSARDSFGGKVIEDHFIQQVDGVDDAAAFTLRTYCEETQRWEMVFLWAGRPATGAIGFVGNRVNNEMHLNLQQLGPNGLVILVRIRFFDINDNSFSWENHTSVDNGVTWVPSISLKLRRCSGGS
jgi:hypothetical protein